MTTKQSGLGDNFYIGGFDLSGDVASIDAISGGPALIEQTGIKQSAHQRGFGLRAGSMKFTSLFEQTPAITTPGMPATNTPVTSTYNVPVQVTITGGTLTNVLVNGTSAGTTAGTYTVPPFGMIAIVYSVAPTWNWFALGAEHSALAPLPRADVTCMYVRGAAVGNPAACMIGKQLNYDATRDNTGNLTFQCEVDSNGYGYEWGTLLTAGIRTDSAATNGTSRNDGAGTTFGAQFYLQLFELVGTNVDVNVQHSVDNTTWSTLFDFGSLTSAPQGLRGAVANNATVNQYLRVITTGTFTQAMFAVAINRNTVAGVTF